MILLVIALALLAAMAAGAAWVYHKVTQLEKRCTVGVGLAADHREDLARLQARVDEVTDQVVGIIQMAMDGVDEALAPGADVEPQVCTMLFCGAPRERAGGVVEEMPDDLDTPGAPAEAHILPQ